MSRHLQGSGTNLVILPVRIGRQMDIHIYIIAALVYMIAPNTTPHRCTAAQEHHPSVLKRLTRHGNMFTSKAFLWADRRLADRVDHHRLRNGHDFGNTIHFMSFDPVLTSVGL